MSLYAQACCCFQALIHIPYAHCSSPVARVPEQQSEACVLDIRPNQLLRQAKQGLAVLSLQGTLLLMLMLSSRICLPNTHRVHDMHDQSTQIPKGQDTIGLSRTFDMHVYRREQLRACSVLSQLCSCRLCLSRTFHDRRRVFASFHYQSLLIKSKHCETCAHSKSGSTAFVLLPEPSM